MGTEYHNSAFPPQLGQFLRNSSTIPPKMVHSDWLKISVNIACDWTKTKFTLAAPPAVEGENTTVLWDFRINTDRAIQANRPDIVIKDHKSKTCLLIDMTIPTDRNISVKEFDKLSKYKDLQIEIDRMWHLKTTIVPVVVGALGMVKKGIQNHLNTIPGEPNLQEIQKIVLISTTHLLRKALSI